MYEDKEVKSAEVLPEKFKETKPTSAIDFNKPLSEYTKAELEQWAEFTASQLPAKSMKSAEYLAQLAKKPPVDTQLKENVNQSNPQ